MMILEPNYKEAFKWIEILVKKGSLSAKYDMGVCYFYGRGVPEDKSKAVEIWKSMLGDVVDIIDPNYKDVFKWIEVLARKGSLPAKYDIPLLIYLRAVLCREKCIFQYRILRPNNL